MSEEFTGERLIPGEVDADLWNEHISRYAFAASLCKGAERILDAGCGTGYGSKFLSHNAGSVVGIDASADAIDYAARQYAGATTRFLVGLCEDMPVPAASVDLIVAFEVIEHLAGWRQFLNECDRVLAPDGLLLVSTPNKNDYSESRRDAGPNPFHVHEFEFAEFSEELGRLFPHVRIFGQNHADGIVFAASGASGVTARLASLNADPEKAGFFVAVCSRQPIPEPANFVYVPESANMLRERERHIQLLRTDLKDLQERHRALQMELERSNTWAESLNIELKQRGTRIFELQDELRRADDWAAALDRETAERGARIAQLQEEFAEEQNRAQAAVAALEAELANRTAWAQERDADLARCVDLLHAAEQTIEERTLWAQRTQAEADAYAARLATFEASRWVRLGRAIRVGPLPR